MTGKHDERCPNCGRFIPADSDGFYDREWPYHDGAHVLCYCDERCCDEKRVKDRAERGEATFAVARMDACARRRAHA